MITSKDLHQLSQEYISSSETARVLGIHPVVAGKLARAGRLPAVKIANRWLIPRAFVEEFAKTYVPRRGRPRKKRKYTRRKQE